VLRGSKTRVWIEGSSARADDPQEAEADRFSRDLLIPAHLIRELGQLRSEAAVRSFASRAGIAPSIVVGRLQHDGYWPHSRGNALRRRLTLADTDTGTA
jgi:hypothetical protein